jgi:hypothetical protein
LARLTQFYTYLYLREDGTVKYVGKGTKRRAFEATNHRGLTPKDKNLILLQEHPSEADAFEAEIFLILYYGRIDKGTGCLRNLTDGGEGAAHGVSEEQRQKLRERMMGNQYGKGKNLGTRPPSIGRKISAKMKGNKNGCGPRRPRSKEHSRKLGLAHKGKPETADHRGKISEGLKRAYAEGRRNQVNLT